MNILILSCGTRNKLVRYFKEADSGFDKVICADCSEYAPALYEADTYYIVPRMTSPDYFTFLDDICCKENIDVILPLQEEELMLISENKHTFEEGNILTVISDYRIVELCKDKFSLNDYLVKNGVSAVPTYLCTELSYRTFENRDYFVKPRYGAGSVDAFRIKSLESLKWMQEEIKEELIVQPALNGKEYGVNIYVDMLSGELTDIFIMEKLRMRSGETEKSISVKNKDIAAVIEKLVGLLKMRGPIDIDIMEQDGQYYILEINPRFGGGYPHTHECGVKFTTLIANNALGKVNPVRIGKYEEGVCALKYSDVIIKPD